MGVEYAPKVHNQSGDYVARRVKRRAGLGGRGKDNIIYCGDMWGSHIFLLKKKGASWRDGWEAAAIASGIKKEEGRREEEKGDWCVGRKENSFDYST